VGHERRADRGEQDAGGAVVNALPAEPQAALDRIEADQVITVCPGPPAHPSPSVGSIVIRRKWFKLSFVGVFALALVLALSACGGDDEDEPAATGEARTETGGTRAETTDSAPATETETEAVPPPTAEAPTETEPQASPEDQPGGAGDEEPARTLALFTGENGRIAPRVIRVPAFISIRVELRSADGRQYGLSFDGATLSLNDGLSSVSTTLEGLRPGAAVVGRPRGGGTRVRIEATAEPGP
jgi:hypothetical protein